jgi:hypothetical protein
MPAFATFLRVLRDEGRARLTGPPRLDPGERQAVLAILHDAFRVHVLDIAGPPLVFAPATAVRAALWTAWACWFFVHRGEPGEAVEQALPIFSPEEQAAEHASADVVLRLLPGPDHVVCAQGDVVRIPMPD